MSNTGSVVLFMKSQLCVVKTSSYCSGYCSGYWVAIEGLLRSYCNGCCMCYWMGTNRAMKKNAQWYTEAPAPPTPSATLPPRYRLLASLSQLSHTIDKTTINSEQISAWCELPYYSNNERWYLFFGEAFYLTNQLGVMTSRNADFLLWNLSPIT